MGLVVFAALIATAAVVVTGLRVHRRYRRRWSQRRFVRAEARRGIVDLEHMLAECAQMPLRRPRTARARSRHRPEPR